MFSFLFCHSFSEINPYGGFKHRRLTNIGFSWSPAEIRLPEDNDYSNKIDQMLKMDAFEEYRKVVSDRYIQDESKSSFVSNKSPKTKPSKPMGIAKRRQSTFSMAALSDRFKPK